jgi:hypothetical protein|tara:strand:- start:571 stop:837 length:267 start_codon:yes stop_codon:yes gene_type:complete
MKLDIAEKSVDIVQAKAKHILLIEEKLGKPITKIGTEPSFSDMFSIFSVAVLASDSTITEEWLQDNVGFDLMPQMAEVVQAFLEVPQS